MLAPRARTRYPVGWMLSVSPTRFSCQRLSGPILGFGLRTGGYWNEHDPLAQSFVRTHEKQSQREIKAGVRKRGDIKQHVAAVNSLQDVPWRINGRVLEQVITHAERLEIERLTKKLSLKHDRVRENTIAKWTTKGFTAEEFAKRVQVV